MYDESSCFYDDPDSDQYYQHRFVLSELVESCDTACERVGGWCGDDGSGRPDRPSPMAVKTEACIEQMASDNGYTCDSFSTSSGTRAPFLYTTGATTANCFRRTTSIPTTSISIDLDISIVDRLMYPSIDCRPMDRQSID